jgi:hypothetical protein
MVDPDGQGEHRSDCENDLMLYVVVILLVAVLLQMSSEIEMAWAAGLFDGEGCISIGCVLPTKRNGLRNRSYRLTVKVTMGCKKSVDAFHKIIGVGTVQPHVDKSDRVNQSWSWVTMSRLAEVAIRKLFPYLISKVSEALVALELMELPDVQRGGRGGSKEIPKSLLKKKHSCYVRCAKLKSRFKFRRFLLHEKP